ncbi:MAG: D-aminoacylase [Vicinamibacterales bacterium]
MNEREGRMRRALSASVTRLSWLATGAACVAAVWQIHAQAPAYDLLVRGGRIVDGAGGPWYVADVGIKGDTIAAVGPHLDAGGAPTVDATGLVVAPGFIDVHSHAEARSGGGLVGVPGAENYVRQGVTSVFANPDGGGDVPLKPFLDRVAAARPAINLGSFIGQGSIRGAVVGMADRKATADEIRRMQALVREGMEEGAFGLSTGLFYVPGNYAPLDEVVELAKVAGQMGGIHQSHMRNETAGVLDSVRETIAIGERGGLPTQVTHHKIIGKGNWGRSVDTLKLVEEARARGVDATIDQYPYTASSTSIQGALIPQWAQEGGRDAMLERFLDPAARGKIRAEIARLIDTDRGGGDPANVVIAAAEYDPSLAGKNLSQILRERSTPVTLETAADLVMEIVRKGGAQGIYHAIDEGDLVRILQHPLTMVASDGGVPEFGKDAPHPRSYGTFARVLGTYVRERGLLPLEDAVRKMSSYPAARMRLTDRGLVRPGLKADLAIFDPLRVKDMATFDKPHQYAVGMVAVVVNGQLVLDKERITGARPGRVLRGPGTKR